MLLTVWRWLLDHPVSLAILAFVVLEGAAQLVAAIQRRKEP